MSDKQPGKKVKKLLPVPVWESVKKANAAIEEIKRIFRENNINIE